MPSNSRTNVRVLRQNPPLSKEESELDGKLLEVQNSLEDYHTELEDLTVDNRLAVTLYRQLIVNSEQMVDDAIKHAKRAKETKSPVDFGIAMGFAEGLVEWLTKPLLPQD